MQLDCFLARRLHDRQRLGRRQDPRLLPRVGQGHVHHKRRPPAGRQRDRVHLRLSTRDLGRQRGHDPRVGDQARWPDAAGDDEGAQECRRSDQDQQD